MKFERAINISADTATVFSEYKDVPGWPQWDPDTESASIDGEFAVGATGKIKPKGAPMSRILWTEVTENQSFTVECKLPLCKMRFVHTLSGTDDGTRVVNSVAFSGLLAPVFGRLIGKSIDENLPESLSGLKQHIETGKTH